MVKSRFVCMRGGKFFLSNSFVDDDMILSPPNVKKYKELHVSHPVKKVRMDSYIFLVGDNICSYFTSESGEYITRFEVEPGYNGAGVVGVNLILSYPDHVMVHHIQMLNEKSVMCKRLPIRCITIASGDNMLVTRNGELSLLCITDRGYLECTIITVAKLNPVELYGRNIIATTHFMDGSIDELFTWRLDEFRTYTPLVSMGVEDDIPTYHLSRSITTPHEILSATDDGCKLFMTNGKCVLTDFHGEAVQTGTWGDVVLTCSGVAVTRTVKEGSERTSVRINDPDFYQMLV